ncbi:MAG TPA: AI-2E family transporter, partial [Allocoleopsis sp.]
GLNPLWIFISVLMGAQIAGLLGVVVAVPLAGTIKDTVDLMKNTPNQLSVISDQ